MANGNIGLSMAQKTVDELLDESVRRRGRIAEAWTPEGERWQQEVNYALLLGMSAILHQTARQFTASMAISAATAGAVVGAFTFFFG